MRLSSIEQIYHVLRYWLFWLREKDRFEQKFDQISLNSLTGEEKKFFTFSLHHHDIQDFLIGERKEISLNINEEIQAFLRFLLKNSAFLSHFLDSEKFLLGFPLIEVCSNHIVSTIPMFRFSLEEILFQSKFSLSLSANQFMQRQLPLSQFESIILKKSNANVLFDEFLQKEIFYLSKEDLDNTDRRNECFQTLPRLAISQFLSSKFDNAFSNEQIFFDFFSAIEKQIQHEKAILIPKCMIFSASHSGSMQLQKDISEILIGKNIEKLNISHPFLKFFIGKEKEHFDTHPIWAQTHSFSFTPSQLHCLTATLKKNFSVISGPPGTGKTCLITDIIANTFVQTCFEFSFALAKPKDCKHINVVASTNNQAVDNVIDWMNDIITDQKNIAQSMKIPQELCIREIPLGLRIGNREKLTTTMNEQLEIAIYIFQKRLQASELKRFQEIRKLLAQNRVQQQKLSQWSQQYTQPHQRLNELKKSLSQLNQNIEQFHETDKNESVQNFFSKHHEFIEQLQKKLDIFLRKFESVQTEKMRERIATEFQSEWQVSLKSQYQCLLSQSKEFLSEPIQPLDFDIEDAETSVYQLREHIIDFRKIMMKNRSNSIQVESAKQIKDRLLHEYQELKKSYSPLPKKQYHTMIKEYDRLRFQAFLLAIQMSEAWAFAHKDFFIPLLSLYKERVFSKNILELSSHEHLAMLGLLFPVLGCTLNSIRNFFPLDHDILGTFIVDEASLSHPSYIISGLFRCNNVVILGDKHQLEPVLPDGLKNVECGIDLTEQEKQFCLDESQQSLQALAENAVSSKLRLSEHFRCQREIMQISNELCDYQLEILTPKNKKTKARNILSSSLLYHDIDGEESLLGTSIFNLDEVKAVTQCVELLLAYKIPEYQIGIITPYLAQKGKIKQALREKNISLSEDDGIIVETIYGFQGGEKEIIIFSLVKKQKQNHAQNFLNRKRNMLNVAVSRAQNHLIVIGSLDGLKYGRFGNILYKHLLQNGKPLTM